MTKRAVLVGLAGVVGTAVASHFLGSRPDAAYGDGPLAPCPGTPNCALVRVPLAAAPEQAQAAARRAVQSHGSWRTGRAVRVTPTADGTEALFAVGPFRDRLAVAVEADGAGGSTLWIRSAAGQGRSDLGVNRARARQIAEAVRSEVG